MKNDIVMKLRNTTKCIIFLSRNIVLWYTIKYPKNWKKDGNLNYSICKWISSTSSKSNDLISVLFIINKMITNFINDSVIFLYPFWHIMFFNSNLSFVSLSLNFSLLNESNFCSFRNSFQLYLPPSTRKSLIISSLQKCK